jgi:hypothetical protein
LSASSGFELREKNAGAFNINDEFFPSDLTFEDTPENVERTIQVQIQTASAATLEITLDGTTFVPINNMVALAGLGTFTMLVEKTTLLNFRNTDVAGLVVSIVVAA